MFRAGISVALAGLLMAMAPRALAQIPEHQGFFAHLDGRWMWGGDRLDSTLIGRSSNGPGGQAMIGYKMTPTFDVALAGDVQGLLTTLTTFQNGTLSVDMNHQHFDLEAGFSNEHVRVNAGLRGIHYYEGATYYSSGGSSSNQRDMLGIGPKIGIGGALPLSDTWSLIGEADAALVYTQFSDSGSGFLLNNATYWQFVPQLGAELGVSWRSSDTPGLSFATGAKVFSSFGTAVTANGAYQSQVEVGPFIRMAYNFGGGRRSVVAAITSDAPEAPALPKAPVRTAWFDFGSDRIPIVAQATIHQAAEEARQGRRSILRVAGPTDSAQLALRRANAVSLQLQQQGVAVSDIAIGVNGERPTATALIQIVD